MPPYKMIKLPGHPGCNNTGYVYEHRIIMERKLGRPLRTDEIIHHIDGDTYNNNINNLRLLDGQGAHHKITLRRNNIIRRINHRLCERCGTDKTYWDKVDKCFRWTRSKIKNGWLCQCCAHWEYLFLKK